jgi:hypothetical protein
VKTQRILQWYNKLISYANLFFKIFDIYLQRIKTNTMNDIYIIIDEHKNHWFQDFTFNSPKEAWDFLYCAIPVYKPYNKFFDIVKLKQ